MSLSLHSNPDWKGAATALVNGLSCLPQAEQRLDLLEAVCTKLGTQLYPAFLSILFHIERSANAETRQLLASALVDCLASGRLPSGEANAWGAASASKPSGFHSARKLGPIEYLCAWQVQGDQQDQLPPQTFVDVLGSVIALTNADNKARMLYISKLSLEATDPMTGSFSRSTRSGMAALVEAWQQELPVHIIADRFLSKTKPVGLLDAASQFSR